MYIIQYGILCLDKILKEIEERQNCILVNVLKRIIIVVFCQKGYARALYTGTEATVARKKFQNLSYIQSYVYRFWRNTIYSCIDVCTLVKENTLKACWIT